MAIHIAYMPWPFHSKISFALGPKKLQTILDWSLMNLPCPSCSCYYSRECLHTPIAPWLNLSYTLMQSCNSRQCDSMPITPWLNLPNANSPTNAPSRTDKK